MHQGAVDAAAKLPKIRHKGRAQTPYLTVAVSGPNQVRRKDSKSEDEDSPAYDPCQECDENNSPDVLPVHPGCKCEPIQGWAKYLDEKEGDKPSNWTDKEWSNHISELRKKFVPKLKPKKVKK